MVQNKTNRKDASEYRMQVLITIIVASGSVANQIHLPWDLVNQIAENEAAAIFSNLDSVSTCISFSVLEPFIFE